MVYCMSYFKKLVGEKVYLSPVSANDEAVQKYLTWMNDFGVTDYTGRSTFMATEQAEKAWLEDATSGKEYTFSIVLLENDKMVGTVGFNKIDNVNRRAVLGIMIGDDEDKSKGYGTEAINLLLDFGFNYLNMHNIVLTVLADNARARRCYEKCGFKLVGREEEAIYINGKYLDKLYMQILKKDFNGEYIKNKNL